MHPIEKDIAGLLRDKDHQAISLIMEYYGDTLYGIALKMMGNPDEAEDVIQDSFIKIWKNASQYNSKKARLFTWLLSIVRNTAIDQIRKKNNRQTKHQNSSNGHSYITQMYPEHMDVKDKVSNMEGKYRDVIELLFFGGLTQKEASDRLNIPLGTVKTRLKIGLRHLRSVFLEQSVPIIIIMMIF